MKNRTLAMGLAAICLAAGITMAAPVNAWAADTLPEGLYVGEVSLGGMTEEEAGQKIESLVKEMENQKITLVVDGQSIDTTAKDLGFHWSNPDAVKEAASSYQGGNLIRRYLSRKDIEYNPVTIPLETSLDDGLVTTFVEEKCASVVEEPKNAEITRENGSFTVTPSVIGKAVDAVETKKTLDEAVADGLTEPVVVTATVEETLPEITTEDLSTIGDLLGTFTTSFASSGQARSTNLRVGSGKINGHVLMPGETLSGYECMHPFTTANGYATAAAYENGQVVDSVGGGVCQISTTLFNAALLAELEITQRQNHSMIVNYVKPSQDAAIAGTYKDLKITNNYTTPIYVEGFTSGKTLTFNIYGKETRPENRTIEFVSETLKVTDPGAPKEQFDPTLPPGTRKQVQSAHKGYKSRLWKYVYVDGVEQSREILHTDTYNASKAIVKVGPAVPAVTVPEEVPTPDEETTQIPGGTPGGTPDTSGTPGGDSGNAGGPGANMPAPGGSPNGPVGPECRKEPYMRRIERENTGTMRPGQDLVIAGYAGLAGTIETAKCKKEELRQWFSETYLNRILEQEQENEKLTGNLERWKELGAAECEPAGEGGILTALWNLSGAYMTGIEFSLRRIPVKQETIEICERYDLNPYRLLSDGCLLLVADNGLDLVHALEDQGIHSAVIGKVTRGIKRIINHGESVGYLDRPTEDEIHKIRL